MIENPKLRVFHIDTECYVVYVGNNPNDHRPFLRVGNSRFLPERAKSFISSVIITDSLTGNQLIELENLEIPLNGETRYIGDPEAVAKLKQFLEDNNIPSEAYDDGDVADTPPEKSGAFVYFYKNGDIQLFHDKERLFDLQEEERADGHFVYRAEKAVQAVKANPFRYMASDLTPPGFFFSGDKPFFFREGKVGTISVSSDYIRDLGKYGFDPDILSWLVEDRISEGLLCRFKRATVTKKDIRIATLDLKKFQNAAALFTPSGLSCVIVHLEKGEEKNFSGFALKRRDDSLAVGFPDSARFPEVVFPENAEVSDGHFLARTVKETGAGGDDFFPIEGVPYRILDGEEDAAALIKTYMLDVAARLKDMEDSGGQETLKTLETLAQGLTASPGSAAGKALSGHKDKNIAEGAPEEMLYLLWNIHEFARLAAFRKGTPAAILKNSGRLASLAARPDMPLKNTTRLPVLGDLLRTDTEWFVFYRWNTVLSKNKLLQAQKSCESIEKLGVQDNENFYVSERQRLIDFIGGLTENPARKRKPIAPPPAAAASYAQDRAAELAARTAGKSSSGTSSDEENKAASSSAAAAGASAASAKTASSARSSQSSQAHSSSSSSFPSSSSAASFSASETRGTRSTIEKAGAGKFLLPALIILALGGGAFLLMRGCSGTAGDEGALSAQESGKEAGAQQQAQSSSGDAAAVQPGTASQPGAPAGSTSGAEGEPGGTAGRQPDANTEPAAAGQPDSGSGAVPDSSRPGNGGAGQPGADTTPGGSTAGRTGDSGISQPGTNPAPGAAAASGGSRPGGQDAAQAADDSPGAQGQTSGTPGAGTQAQTPGGTQPGVSGAGQTGPAAPSPGTPAGQPSALPPEIDPASIRITILDIFYCTNETAVKNGYSPLDENDGRLRDPNWIYPGRTLTLPNNAVHMVQSQDTMWGISIGYIRENIRELCLAYDSLVRPYRPGAVPADRKEEVAGKIRELIGRCKSENLRRILDEKLRNV